jgi:pyruvate/2-oxoglutarate dehydrogenase complex dihydrolipoamide dehydrogenase (E3) component
MTTAPESFKAIIIGAGQAGVPLAQALADAGWKTAIIERSHVGGTCINVGCTPTKTMVASARVAHLARRTQDYGVHVGEVRVSLAKVVERKRSVVQSFRQGNRQRLQDHESIELIRGEASFSGPKTIRVQLQGAAGERVLEAEVIVINSGGRPRQPALTGLDQVKALDSSSIMELERLPQHLIVLGGGYVGLEFGQMFRRFGSQVTIVQRGSQLLMREDEDIAQEVSQILKQEGIDILLEAEATSVRADDDGNLMLAVKQGEATKIVEGSHLLLAVGRVPNIEALNLAAAAIELDERNYIRVNDRLETSADSVYAVGDVKGGPAFTHTSYDDYRVLAANLLEGASRTITDRMVPYTVFIDPQLGRVGLTEKQAERAGLNFQVSTMPMRYVARAIEVDETRGMLKAVVDGDSRQILGVAFLGIEGGELMSAIQIAMQAGLPYTALRDGIFAHPTLAESFNNLFANLD